MLVDSHCHLDYLERDGDLDEVVGRARRAGVGAMITICTKLSEFDRVRAIAERYDEVSCSVGVHPHEAEAEGQEDARRLVALAEHPKVVAESPPRRCSTITVATTEGGTERRPVGLKRSANISSGNNRSRSRCSTA